MRWIPKVVALPSPCGPPRELAASRFYGQAQMYSNVRAYCHFIYLFILLQTICYLCFDMFRYCSSCLYLLMRAAKIWKADGAKM